MKSLYERLGGESTIDQAVLIFYKKLLKDERIRNFFVSVDLDEQVNKQRQFLKMVLGGPNNYTGKNIRESHARLHNMGLRESDVDAVLKALGDTLQEMKVDEKDIAEVIAVADKFRDDVLGR